MGITHLWDTNTVIYDLQQQFPPRAESFIDQLITQSNPAISAITEIELLSWKAAKEADLKLIQNFIHDSWVFELDQSVKVAAAVLRRTYSIKLADAVIGATALVFDLTLVTRNSEDFTRIDKLKLINPWIQ
ncbi:MAG: type II toxin-antitoxin system VapC family toxin [Cyclobacteriaceae bacterium]|nr:type II toxin-antitoxin system VapC family toxin [Cyclobacteriaceae bacterium]